MPGRKLGDLPVKVGGDIGEYFRNCFPVLLRACLGYLRAKNKTQPGVPLPHGERGTLSDTAGT